MLTTLTQICEAVVENLSQQGARLQCDALLAIDQTVADRGAKTYLAQCARCGPRCVGGEERSYGGGIRRYLRCSAILPASRHDCRRPRCLINRSSPVRQGRNFSANPPLIDTVPLSGGLGPVAENMAEMPAAIRAMHFGARVADLVIGAGAHGPLVRLPARSSASLCRCHNLCAEA